MFRSHEWETEGPPNLLDVLEVKKIPYGPEAREWHQNSSQTWNGHHKEQAEQVGDVLNDCPSHVEVDPVLEAQVLALDVTDQHHPKCLHSIYCFEHGVCQHTWDHDGSSSNPKESGQSVDHH